MEVRKLGRTGLLVGRIGLGCVTFGREIGEPESFAVMDHAYEHGVNLFDTAEAYTGADSSEAIIGRWMEARGYRDRVVVQTKVMPPLTQARVLQALDQSLSRLRTDYVDVLLLHTYDSATPIEESLEALAEARRTGKIRAGGCSNFTAAQLFQSIRLAERMGIPRLETIEPIYNYAHREIEEDLLPLCAREDIGVTSYSPLGAGFLTGKHSPGGAPPAGSRFAIKPGHQKIYYTAECFAALEDLRQLSAATGLPMARLAMEWVWGRHDIDAVLVGARTTAHLDNAFESLRHAQKAN